MFAEFDRCKATALDGAYMRQWARHLKVDDLLDRLFVQEEIQ